MREIDSFEVIEEASKDLGKLRNLVEERHKFRCETRNYLKKWLLHGSIYLNEYGGFSLFSPSEPKEFPIVKEGSEDTFGTTIIGGTQGELPRKCSICPYCGKEITLEDVYQHNFNVQNGVSYHSGECEHFHNRLIQFSTISKDMISMAKRTLQEVKEICVKEDIEEEIKIQFSSLGYQFEIIVIMYGGSISITYDKDGNKGDIISINHFCGCCLKGIEEKLRNWIKDNI